MISTDWSGSAEIVVDGESGLLTSVADPEAMAETIEQVLSQPDLAARLAENGWKRCAETFSSEAVGEQMINFYRTTIEDARA
jgi:glycosyltransferase involved in cell wall biosynthesis